MSTDPTLADQYQGFSMRKQELHPRTAVINKKQQNQSKIIRNKALHWLAATFPKAFDNSISIQPLKSGIMADILSYADEAAIAGISKSKLREAVVLYTRRIDYLTCLKAREVRIDLQGNPVIQVTDEEAEQAAAKIRKHVEKRTRNARKELASNAPVYPKQQTSTIPDDHEAEEFIPCYPKRAPAFSSQNTATQAPKAPTVVIKHKSARQYDPNAVARLKEKLGLSREKGAVNETVE